MLVGRHIHLQVGKQFQCYKETILKYVIATTAIKSTLSQTGMEVQRIIQTLLLGIFVQLGMKEFLLVVIEWISIDIK